MNVRAECRRNICQTHGESMLAVIGGTGLYELPGMQVQQHLDEPTPFGAPSGRIVKGTLAGRELLFLARHGAGHKLLPHEVNYRANVYALKRAGATQILGFSAVGSLVQEIAPGDLAMPTQHFDWTRGGRARSFFGDGVAAHVSTAHPVSANMVDWVAAQAARMGVKLHRGVTYACVCIATDYDCWMDDPAMHASVSAILAQYRQTLEHARALLDALLAGPLPEEEPEIRSALREAMMTPESALTEAQREWLAVLRR
jgi:5'-methylthioadenosine phosphorylase